MKIARTDSFKKAWEKLSETEKSQGRKAIQFLLSDMRHPGLRVKRIKGTGDIWEARASRSLRITFQMDKDIIILRNIGDHDRTLGRP